MESLRRPGSRENDDHGRATTTTLLTLPLSDFSSFASAACGRDVIDDHDDSEDGQLILISLPQSSSSSSSAAAAAAGGVGIVGLTLEDLLRAGDHNENYNSVYILGDTSEHDIISNHHHHHHHRSSMLSSMNYDGGSCAGTTTGRNCNNNNNNSSSSNSIEPVPARLIVEGQEGGTLGGKTLELTRVETSNTYIVVPTSIQRMKDGTTSSIISNGTNKRMMMGTEGNKRQRIIKGGNSGNITSHSQEEENTNDTVQLLVTVPARSIGLVPGEDSPSCFFLEPLHLPPGHFAPTLRRILARWVYDPFNPPPPSEEEGEENENEERNTQSSLFFGYSIPEIAHICRTSIGEIEYAIRNRVFGAEDAMVIPSKNAKATSSSSGYCSRYGMLSEEGRQTVSMAIVSALIESDLDLGWWFVRRKEEGHQKEENTNGMQLAVLMKEIKAQWHQIMEGGEDTTSFRQSSFHATTTASSSTNNHNYLQSSQNDSQSSQFGTPSQFIPSSTQKVGGVSSGELPAEIIWHCLRPLCFYGGGSRRSSSSSIMTTANKDSMPEYVHLIPDEVAKVAVHQVFLNGTPRSLQGNPSSRMGTAWPEEELLEEWSMRLPSISSSYEPRMELLRGIAISEWKEGACTGAGGGDDIAANDHVPKKTTLWTYFPEVALPLDPALRIQTMFIVRDVWTLSEAVPYLEKFVAMVPGKEDKEGGGDSGGGKDGVASVHSMVADLLGRHAKIFRRDLNDTIYYCRKH